MVLFLEEVKKREREKGEKTRERERRKEWRRMVQLGLNKVGTGRSNLIEMGVRSITFLLRDWCARTIPPQFLFGQLISN